MAYGMVVVQSRLMEMDRSIEEAAMDLGARPISGVLPGHHAQASPRRFWRRSCWRSRCRLTMW
jgi:hypothetical protein